MDNSKPDLFEMGMLELLNAYREMWKAGEFSYQVISTALDHVLEATKIIQESHHSRGR